METETLAVTMPNKTKKGRYPRGLLQRVPGKDSPWWIRYTDAQGRLRREKAGTKGMAIDLYRKRKTETLAGRKFPENLRKVNMPTLRGFAQRFVDAVQIECARKPQTTSTPNR